MENQVAGGSGRTLPQFLNVGFSADFGTRLSRMKFHLDARDLTNQVEKNFYKKIHLGTELDFAHFLAFGRTQSGIPGGIF